MLYDPKWKTEGGWLWPNRACAIAALFVIAFVPWAIVSVILLRVSWWLWPPIMVTTMAVQTKLLNAVTSTFPRNGWL